MNALRCLLVGLTLVVALAPRAAAVDGIPAEIKPDQKGNLPYAWVIYDRLDVRAEPDLNRKPVREPLNFLDRYVIAQTVQAKGGEFAYLVSLSRDHRVIDKVGWVERKGLLLHPHAIQSPRTLLHRKGMVITSAKSQQFDPKGRIEDQGMMILETLLYRRPDTNAPVANKVALFNVYFIYERYDDPAQKPTPQAKNADPEEEEESGFYLLGTAHAFHPNTDAKEVILGWVPKVRVTPWETREAWEWDHTTTLPGADTQRVERGNVWRNPRDAQSGLQGANVKPIWSEIEFDLKRGARPMSPGDMRYPVLSWRPSESKNPEMLGYMGPKKSDRRNQLYRTGVYGGRFSPSGVEQMTGKQLAEHRQKMADLEKDARMVEILFVIDETVSMDVWYNDVVPSVCEEILAAIRKERAGGDAQDPTKALDLKVGVAFFNDVDNPLQIDSAVDIRLAKLRNFAAEGQDLIDKLRKHNADPMEKQRRHGGGDPKEQVFRGLLRGIKAADFSKDGIGPKLVILIGDNGNNPKLDKNLKDFPTSARIAEHLIPIPDSNTPYPPSPIEFFALQVNDPDPAYALPADEREGVKAFETEADAILKAAAARLAQRRGARPQDRKTGWQPGQYFALRADPREKRLSPEVKKQAVDLIRARALSRYDDAMEMVQKLRSYQAGVYSEPGEALEIIFKERGLDFDRYIRQPGAQWYQDGYVWRYTRDGVQQVRSKVLMSKGELEALIPVLMRLDPKTPQDPGSQSISLKEAVANVIEVQAGQIKASARPADLSHVSIDDVVFKYRGLMTPVSPVLRLKPDDVAQGVKPQDLFDLLQRVNVLEDIKNGKRYQYAKQPDKYDGQDVIRYERDNSTGEDVNRVFHLGTNRAISWYWIDLETEWP